MPKLVSGQETVQVIISSAGKEALEALAKKTSKQVGRKISVGEIVRGLIQEHFDANGIDARVDEGLGVWGSSSRKESEDADTPR